MVLHSKERRGTARLAWRVHIKLTMPMKIALCQLNPTVGDLSLAYGLRTSAGRLS